MFDAENITVSSGSKYQEAGVSERVTITEVVLLENMGVESIQLKTVNDKDQIGQSKRLSLKTEVSPGKSVAAWTVSAKYLLNVIKSATGLSDDDSRAVLKAGSVKELVQKLTNALVGKVVRGLFSSREYQPGKFAIELYITEAVGGTRLVWDINSKFYNSRLAIPEGQSESGKPSDLPF